MYSINHQSLGLRALCPLKIEEVEFFMGQNTPKKVRTFDPKIFFLFDLQKAKGPEAQNLVIDRVHEYKRLIKSGPQTPPTASRALEYVF